MPKPSEAPIQIEPLTKDEQKERGTPTHVDLSTNPEFPKEWDAKDVSDAVGKGFKYYRRTKDGKLYMLLRKGKHDKGLGQWSEEKEGKLFTFYPNLGTMGGIEKPPPWTPQGATQQRSYLAVPINRVAIIPRDYVPSISVIRYFQVVKENGFPGDFSKFVNDIVVTHFRNCHGITLPVLIEEEMEVMREEECQKH